MVKKVNKPHIVIDARLYGPRHTGLGRYTKNLLVAISQSPEFPKYKFTLLVYPETKSEITHDLGNKFNLYVTKIRHYSLADQLVLPFVIKSLHPTLVHFTHLDKPIFYFGKSVVTIHDLIRHFSKGRETTTRNLWLYWPKYWGYLLMSWFTIHFQYLIVPSNFWRDYIINHYQIKPQRIITTYEAVDPNIKPLASQSQKKPKPYILYTGNLYPHKNIIVVLQALQKLPNISLKIICTRDLFQKRIQKLTKDLRIQNQVDFLGFVPDSKFHQLYSQAICLVHPSLYEGFSLTGLESMALNCPVISANSSCLPEIYGNSVLYFNPLDASELVSRILKLYKNMSSRRKLIRLGRIQIKKYSWTKTAEQTLGFYKHLIKN